MICVKFMDELDETIAIVSEIKAMFINYFLYNMNENGLQMIPSIDETPETMLSIKSLLIKKVIVETHTLSIIYTVDPTNHLKPLRHVGTRIKTLTTKSHGKRIEALERKMENSILESTVQKCM